MEIPDGDQRWGIVETETWCGNIISRGNMQSISTIQRYSGIRSMGQIVFGEEDYGSTRKR